MNFEHHDTTKKYDGPFGCMPRLYRDGNPLEKEKRLSGPIRYRDIDKSSIRLSKRRFLSSIVSEGSDLMVHDW
jgi:hypothetical protein